MTKQLPYSFTLPSIAFFIFFSFTSLLRAQPCNNWTTVACGVDQTFVTTAGAGLSNYSNGLGTSCYNSSGTGGQESIYKFYAPNSGVFQFQTTTSANATVEYFYKFAQSDACVGTGWSCLGYTSSATHLDALALNANDSIWIIANSESAVTAVSQQFRITCLPNPCASITPLQCDVATTFSIAPGYGHPSFSNGLNTTCYNNSGQGASEVYYSFTAPATGTYQFRTTAWISGGTAEYFYKLDSGDPCSSTGWTCLGYTSSTTILDAINLNQGQTIYLLINAESVTTTTSQTFIIDCVDPFSCEEISTVTCGVPIDFSVDAGLGDPLFYNGLTTTCYNNSGQGGDQRVYLFEATQTGTYHFEVLSWGVGGTVEYFYKMASGDPCVNTGWTCLGYRSSPGALDAINLDAGTTIYLLLNAENFTTASQQTWQIRCAVPYACTNIQTVTCGEVVSFATDPVLGDPEFYNGVGTTCYSNSGQGGQERIYQFTAAETGTYEIRTITSGTTTSEYLYKLASLDPCSASNWICLGYTGGITALDAINLDAGQSIWILVNSEATTLGANQQFTIDCAVPFACTAIETISCGSAQWVEVPTGYGNPNFYNGLTTTCYNNSGQGAGERIYSFTAPSTGTYLFEVLAAPISSVVEYFYKSGTADPCSNSGWVCLGYNSGTNFLDAINLTANETIYILANAESASLGARQLFQVRCGLDYPCLQMNQVSCGVNTMVAMPSGFGNPIYNNGLGTSCYSNSGQGGGEQIFQFVAPTTGQYNFSVTQASSNVVFEYFTMVGTGNPCLATGWQCLGYRSNPGNLGVRTINAGEVLFILVNSESTTGSFQEFTISCASTNSLSVVTSVTQVSCNGGANGAIQLTIGGGQSPYTVDWADLAGNANVEDRTGLSAGMYSATITDANGAEITQDFEINEPFPLQVFIDVVHPSAVGINDGSIQLTLVGAPSPYNTDWTDLLGTNNSEDRINLGEGAYCVNITDANGCLTNTCEDLVVGGLTALDAEANLTYPSCTNFNDGSIDLLISGGQAPYTVDWLDIPGDNNGEDRANLSAGLYEVIITDVNDESISRTFALSNPPAIDISATITQPTSTCTSNGAIALNVSGGSGNYQAVWSTGTGGFFLQDLDEGEYCVEVTDDNGCVSSSCFDIISPVTYPISLLATVESVTCFGANNGSIAVEALGACGPLEVIWEENASWTTLSIDDLAPGQYHVTVIDANGMTAQGVYTITSPAALDVDLDVTQPSAFNASDGVIDVTVVGGVGSYTYDWQDVAGVNNNAQRINLNPGTYCLTVLDANGCSTTACATLQANNATLQVAIVVGSPTCSGFANGSLEAFASGGVPPYQFDWLEQMGTDDGALWENIEAGEYTVVVSDSNGDEVLQSVIVNDPPALTIVGNVQNASSDIASDGSIDLIITGGSGDYTIAWEGFTFNDALHPEGLGTGVYCVEVEDTNGCVAQACFTVEAPNMDLQVTYSVQDLICFEGGSGGIDLTVSGGAEPYQFDWSDLPGGNDSEDRLFLAAGNYSVTVTDADGDSWTETIAVDQPMAIDVFSQITDASTTGASDGSITLLVTGGTAPFNYDWLDVPGVSNAMNRISLVVGTYCVNITDANGCVIQECFDVDAPDGVNEYLDVHLSIYPNPAVDVVHIRTPHRVLGWELLDMTGHLVSIGQGTALNMETCANGIYFVRIQTSVGSVQRRLIKVNR